MGAATAVTVLSVAFLLIVGAANGSEANVDDEHDPNDNVLLDSLMKTKDSRSFLNDLIYKIQLLLNDTDEHSTTAAPQAVRSAKRVYVSQAAAKPAAMPSNRWMTVKVPTRSNISSISNSSISNNSSIYSNITSSGSGRRTSSIRGNVTSISSAVVLQQHAWMANASLESLLASPELAVDAPVINQTALAANETSAEASAEKQMKKPLGPDASQRVATLGVIICLTFVGTATCIVVMALYSSKFSGIILLSNGRWWCPMVTRGNGVERQLLV
ncbi:hypothetical protein V5799_010378 [Amblyomma americanum]|uniref:Uncharacterized protein n=1 Tax=Amblyomma americanum TaxID=6943 RepID=A0AAQ4EK20_AMBAM